MKTWGLQRKDTGDVLGTDFRPFSGHRAPLLFSTREEAREFCDKGRERVVRLVVSIARPEQEKGR